MRDIYTEQSAVQRLLKNGFAREEDAKKKKASDVIENFNGAKIIKIKSSIGLKLRSAVDYLKNHCQYLVAWI